MNYRIKKASLLVVTLALLASGCSQNTNMSEDKNGAKTVISYEDMQQEFKKSTEALQWPEGYKVPDKAEGEDSASQYQKGYGDTRASMVYECAWEKEWLKVYSKDQDKAKKALDALEKVPSMGYMSPERADDATRRFFNDYLDRAKLGDPSGFQENVTANCP